METKTEVLILENTVANGGEMFSRGQIVDYLSADDVQLLCVMRLATRDPARVTAAKKAREAAIAARSNTRERGA